MNTKIETKVSFSQTQYNLTIFVLLHGADVSRAGRDTQIRKQIQSGQSFKQMNLFEVMLVVPPPIR